MKAVILAGGEGTRLRPLTCNLPKPLVHICGKPVLLYIFDLLKRNECSEAAVAVRYKGEQIESLLGGGRYADMTTTISYEDKPLGTAGCVKKAAEAFEDDFIVISGDAVCDFDLRKAYEYHKNTDSLATIITKSVDDPREYGLIIGENGIVKGFSEKPSYVNCRSDLANTGVYIISPKILSLIPDDTMWDFAGNVFPDMLERGLKLSYIEEDGYWCDIGDISAYKRCNADMANGLIELTPPPENLGAKIKNRNISRSAYISKGSVISENALILGNSVIGSGVYISDGAKLNNAVIMDGAFIGEAVTLGDCIICTDVRICGSAAVYEGAVVGEASVISENSVVSGGVRIWPNKQTEKGAFVNSDIKYGTKCVPEMDDSGITGATNTVITPEFAGKLGSALTKISESGIAVACGGGYAAEAIKISLLCGIASAGKQCFDCGTVPLAALRLSSDLLGCDIFVHITAKSEADIKIYTKGMLPLTRVQERLLENALSRGEYMSAGWSDFGSIDKFNGALPLYRAELERKSDFTVPFSIEVSCSDDILRPLYQSYADKVGSGREKLVIAVGESGTVSEINVGETRLNPVSMILLACAESFGQNEDVSLPFAFPQTADITAEKYGKKVLRFYKSSMDNRDSRARSLAEKQLWLYDGFFLALKVLRFLAENDISPKEALASIPRSSTADRYIRITCPPQRILSRINAAPQENEGAVISSDGERVFLRPDKKGAGIYLYAESFGAETASELCDRTEKLIESVMNSRGNK